MLFVVDVAVVVTVGVVVVVNKFVTLEVLELIKLEFVVDVVAAAADDIDDDNVVDDDDNDDFVVLLLLILLLVAAAKDDNDKIFEFELEVIVVVVSATPAEVNENTLRLFVVATTLVDLKPTCCCCWRLLLPLVPFKALFNVRAARSARLLLALEAERKK